MSKLSFWTKSDFDLKIRSSGPFLVWFLVKIWSEKSQILRFLCLIFWLAALCTLQSPHCIHCEILGSYLQQPHQHHVFRGHFEAEPHSQAEANKWQTIFCLTSQSKLTDSLVTDNTSMPCSARWTEVSGGQAGIYFWFELL